MVEGRLLRFGRLVLTPKPGDYGEMRFYSGSSSSGELDSAKEESYRIARSLGVPSDAELACGFNFRDIGLLPASSAAAAKFSEFCGRSFRAPEVERDLIGESESKLVEANEYHLISVSFFPKRLLSFCFGFGWLI